MACGPAQPLVYCKNSPSNSNVCPGLKSISPVTSFWPFLEDCVTPFLPSLSLPEAHPPKEHSLTFPAAQSHIGFCALSSVPAPIFTTALLMPWTHPAASLGTMRPHTQLLQLASSNSAVRPLVSNTNSQSPRPLQAQPWLSSLLCESPGGCLYSPSPCPHLRSVHQLFILSIALDYTCQGHQ